MRVMHVIEAMHQGGAESLVVEHARLAAPDVETWVCALNRGGPALEAARAAGAHVEVLGGGGLARVAARLAGVHSVLRTEHSFHFAGRHSRFYPVLERASTALTDRVICVCDAVRASHASRLGGDPARFVVILNGVTASPPVRARAEIRRELGAADGEPLVLTVGSLTKQKAQHVLIEAMARPSLASARLAIVGEGALRGELEAQVAKRGLGGRVSLPGARNDVADLLEACDVFVLPSVREGLSVTLLEAMRAGRPAVATRVGGNAEAVEDGVTGCVVPAEDPEALGAALSGLLDDPARRAEFGRAAEERWRTLFTAERMVRETETLYLALHGRRGTTTESRVRPSRGNAA